MRAAAVDSHRPLDDPSRAMAPAPLPEDLAHIIQLAIAPVFTLAGIYGIIVLVPQYFL